MSNEKEFSFLAISKNFSFIFCQQVYRKKYVIYIERIQREKANGATVPVSPNFSRVHVTLSVGLSIGHAVRIHSER